jgi:hypothetical protein
VAADAVFEGLMNAPDLQAFADAYPIDIGPPTDDSPFFFNMLRLRDIFNSRLMAQLVVLLIFGFVTTPIAAALGGASTTTSGGCAVKRMPPSSSPGCATARGPSRGLSATLCGPDRRPRQIGY